MPKSTSTGKRKSVKETKDSEEEPLKEKQEKPEKSKKEKPEKIRKDKERNQSKGKTEGEPLVADEAGKLSTAKGQEKKKKKKAKKAPPSADEAEENAAEKVKASKKATRSSSPSTRRTLKAGEKGEKAVEKEKELDGQNVKFCDVLVEKLWGNAWDICLERFQQRNAPLAISLELRDCWLRIIEMEWLDQDQPREDVAPDLFVPDEPPLPLAFDSWARGALEEFPKSRRESVLDPFLREAPLPTNLDGSGDAGISTVSMTKSRLDTKGKEILDKVPVRQKDVANGKKKLRSRSPMKNNQRKKSPKKLRSRSPSQKKKSQVKLRSRSPSQKKSQKKLKSPMRKIQKTKSKSPIRNIRKTKSKSPITNIRKTKSKSPITNTQKTKSKSPIRNIQKTKSKSPIQKGKGKKTPAIAGKVKGKSPISEKTKAKANSKGAPGKTKDDKPKQLKKKPLKPPPPSDLDNYLEADEFFGEGEEEYEGEYIEEYIEDEYESAKTPTTQSPVSPIRITPPRNPYEWEVIRPPHTANSSDLSPTWSAEYTSIGLQPFKASQCGGPTGSGVFKFPTERSSEALQRARKIKKGEFKWPEELDDVQLSKVTPETHMFKNEFVHCAFNSEDCIEGEKPKSSANARNRGDSRGYDAEYEDSSHDLMDTKSNTIKLSASQGKHNLMSANKGNLATTLSELNALENRPVNVVSRIDNLDHTDSDDVIHILAPHEAPVHQERAPSDHHLSITQSLLSHISRNNLIGKSPESPPSANVNDHKSNAGQTKAPTVTAGDAPSLRSLQSSKKVVDKKKEADVNFNQAPSHAEGKVAQTQKMDEKLPSMLKSDAGMARKNSILDNKEEVIKRQRSSLKGRVQTPKPHAKFS